MADKVMTIVKSKLKEAAKGCNVAGDAADALNEVAHSLIAQAAARAEANGRKTIQAKDAYVGEFTTEPMLTVKSKLKEVAGGMSVSGDFADALNSMLIWTVEQGAARAEANGRKTLGARDL